MKEEGKEKQVIKELLLLPILFGLVCIFGRGINYDFHSKIKGMPNLCYSRQDDDNEKLLLDVVLCVDLSSPQPANYSHIHRCDLLTKTGHKKEKKESSLSPWAPPLFSSDAYGIPRVKLDEGLSVRRRSIET